MPSLSRSHTHSRAARFQQGPGGHGFADEKDAKDETTTRDRAGGMKNAFCPNRKLKSQAKDGTGRRGNNKDRRTFFNLVDVFVRIYENRAIRAKGREVGLPVAAHVERNRPVSAIVVPIAQSPRPVRQS